MPYSQRLSKLQKSDTLRWITDPYDIRYLTGESLSKGLVCILGGKQALFVDGRYIERVEKNPHIKVLPFSKEEIMQFCRQDSFSSIYLNGYTFSYAAYLELKEWFPDIKVQTDQEIAELRAVKDDEEIQLMKQAALITKKGYQFAWETLREGIEEVELAWEIEKYMRSNGADTLSFSMIVGFGEHSSVPHHENSHRKLRLNEPVLIDMGVMYKGYASDMTRTHIFGENAEYKKLQQVVKKGYDTALSHMKAGVSCQFLDEKVIEYFTSVNMDTYICHRLGHSLGLEIHEFPSVSKENPYVLKKNTVVTIEPGLYIPDTFGVRYENMILVTESGYQVLS